LLAGLLVATTAAAGTSNRVWVSGHGIDQSGCGAPTAPCRSLQYAHDHAVAPGGEIDILDPAGYGAITITKALSIVNDGVGTAGVQATSGAAITINAGPSDAVYLRGLNIDGVLKSAEFGVVFNSGAALTIANCIVRHFSAFGVDLNPNSGAPAFMINDDTFADNGTAGFEYEPLGGMAVATGTLDHVIANNNASGVVIDGSNGGQGGRFTVVGAVLNSNSLSGLEIAGDPNTANLIANIDETHMDSNTGQGLIVVGAAIVHVSRSTLDQNTFGINNNTNSPGQIFTNGDNRIEGNGTGKFGGASPTLEGLN
jgi:hypothetical protein